MHQQYSNTQLIELTREFDDGVKFDLDAVSLFGIYRDELSLFRAKRNWCEILESNFLLEPGYDYNLNKVSAEDRSNFVLHCSFLTACGRYAFWRLTNDQAPEAQYLIETAHIPNSDSASEMFITAPDLSPLRSEPPPKKAAETAAEASIDSINTVLRQLKFMFENLSSKFLPK